jgi:hypothetical protein
MKPGAVTEQQDFANLYAYDQGQWRQMLIPFGKDGDCEYWRRFLRLHGFCTMIVKRWPLGRWDRD